MKSNSVGILAVGLAAAMLFAGCSAESYPKADYENQKQTEYMIAGRIAGMDSDVSAQVSGNVQQIFVKEGDFVKAGTTLLAIDTSELQAQLNQAEAGVLAAQANYEKVKTGARQEEKEKAAAALESANKAMELARVNYEREKTLYDSGAVSKQQLESAELQLQNAQSQQTSAKAQMDILSSGETRETIKSSQAQVSQAEAAAEAVRVKLGNATVVAPYDGIVYKKHIEVGEMASQGKLLFTIQGRQNIRVEGVIPEYLIGKLKQGDSVMVKIPDMSEEEYEGAVTVMNPNVDSSGAGANVEVEVKNVGSGIKLGMFAEIGLKK